jgi:hypothetical protein
LTAVLRSSAAEDARQSSARVRLHSGRSLFPHDCRQSLRCRFRPLWGHQRGFCSR